MSGTLACLNDAAGDARRGVAGGLRLVVVGARVDDQAAADDARRAGCHGHDVERGVDARVAAGIGLERRHVAGVALRCRIMRVRLAERVEVAFGAHAIARAAIAGLVDVEAVLLSRVQAADVGDHVNLVAGLRERGGTARRVSLGRLQFRARARSRQPHALASRACDRKADEQRESHFLPMAAGFFLWLATALSWALAMSGASLAFLAGSFF